MAIQPVPPKPATRAFPMLSERALGTYNQSAYDWAEQFPGAVDGMHALAESAHGNATDAAASAVSAQQSVLDASNAAGPALAAANFKGLWSALTGPLNKPACVKHEGRFWMLLNNLANAAASEPGASADWTSLDAGERPSQRISASTEAIAGVCYLFESGVVLTLPATWTKDDYIGWRVLSGVQNASVYFGATPLWGVAMAEGILSLDLSFAPMDLTYENPTWGLK